MKSWRTRLEVVANVALIICCVLFAALLAKHFIFPSKKQDHRPNPQTSLVGKKLTLDQMDWDRSNQTLLIILQKGCRFCDESAPFYQRLTRELSTQPRTRLVALLPHSDDENKQYLKSKMLEITDVRQASPRLIGVPGTPALVLVDNTGTVLEQWLGRLEPAAEEAVISRLKQ